MVGARFSSPDQFPVEPSSTVQGEPMMRFAFAWIVILSFASCASDPKACKAKLADLIGGSAETEDASAPEKDKGVLEKTGDVYDEAKEALRNQTEFEKCLETKCGAKDSCDKKDKDCLSKYEACVSEQTDLAWGRWERELLHTWAGYLGLDWLPFFATLFIALWLSQKFPNSKWDKKSWAKEKWYLKLMAHSWPAVLALLICMGIAKIFHFGTTGFVICLVIFAFMLLQEKNRENRLILDLAEAKDVPESEPDPPPPGGRICPDCKIPVADGNPFCSGCGKPMGERICPDCKIPVADGNPFCSGCGKPMS